MLAKISAFTKANHKNAIFEVQCIDAKEFEIPDERAVFFFYNPFDEYVMRGVLSNIEASLKRSPRQIYLVYVNPVHYELMNRVTFLKNIKREGNPAYTVYAGSMC